ncbi:hypothetical protein VPFG_00169 [Vibrio phage nt-1]|uniref:DUF5591 domain-containing protein n=1 Tax=Vibrio phage nt-1 TaxID=115992 RepID=R9TEI9_9CAUD|nr:hypothetical protein VPFG_00169 [Vibrio phage nt-1]AGN30171.1 hypothetical protein VPFG_00169 [Vibrio phage nt-1]
MNSVQDKSVLMGDELLFSESEWVPFDTMNTEKKILSNPIFDEGLNRIIKQYTPKTDTAFISLCTTTRPYENSRKWKTFMETFGSSADLIVISNGGVIPQQFWHSYPYLNYDGDPKVNPQTELYCEICEERVYRFFSQVKFKNIVANFKHVQRNTEAIKSALKRLKDDGHIENYVVLPTVEQYEELQSRGFPKGKVFPDVDDKILEHLRSAVHSYSPPKENSLANFF